MTAKEIVDYYPDIVKITDNLLIEILEYKFDTKFNRELSWEEMGIDDELDQIELVIEIEKNLNISIPDDLIFEVFRISDKPIDFKIFLRSDKIKKLGL